MSEHAHEPVLLSEAIARLQIRADGWYVDGTYGRGGHAREILRRLGSHGRLWLFDCDPEACAHARQALGGDERVRVAQDSFAQIPEHVRAFGPPCKIDGLLLDLGVSSAQLDQPERGFSFRHDGPLDMRMNQDGPTAAAWLEQAGEQEIAGALREFGEERHARRIAHAIAAARRQSPLTRTRDLAQLIERAVPAGPARRHPATRSFQAIRIVVNRELEQLARLLERVPEMLADEARLAVISFHSLEDRMVKQFMRAHSAPPPVRRHLPAPKFVPILEALPLVRPEPSETARNPRARSARLRCARKLPCAA